MPCISSTPWGPVQIWDVPDLEASGLSDVGMMSGLQNSINYNTIIARYHKCFCNVAHILFNICCTVISVFGCQVLLGSFRGGFPIQHRDSLSLDSVASMTLVWPRWVRKGQDYNYDYAVGARNLETTVCYPIHSRKRLIMMYGIENN